MQPDISLRASLKRITQKEVTLFFASPVAWLFLASFVALALFIFFWAEAFFARNIADIRPLFEWMPVLLIFLSATLTMRIWSDERRTGTLEHVLTQGIPIWHFVLGKFLACLMLLATALLLTLPLPITLSFLADLDWGPIAAGYLATLLLGATYLSMGLFISSKTDNPIVSLMFSCLLAGAFYLLGSPLFTSLFSIDVAEQLRLLGTGSRFESIARGVIDLSDLGYYLSLMLCFLALNTLTLERSRWSGQAHKNHKHWYALTTLVIVNGLALNLWLGQLSTLRLDMTQGRIYSISEATRHYLNRLQEPMLIRGYFSAQTHPLLAPLVPQLKDLIEEYEIQGQGRIRVEFVDPATQPSLEQEANEQYGIKPVPFQISDRYQSSIVSSYFNVLIEYGNEHQVLGFRDLIEVRSDSEADIDVQLRNPEHDLTQAIKHVLQSYQSSGELFSAVSTPLTFTGYISEDNRLPEALVQFKSQIEQHLNELSDQAQGRLAVQWQIPEADGGSLATQLAQDYGFQPMSAGLFSDQSFYFYLTLSQGEQIVQIPLDDMTPASFERNLDAAIKRFAQGFTRTVALVTPQASQGYNPYQPNNPYQPSNPYQAYNGPRFTELKHLLGETMNVTEEDLSDGQVSGAADILFLTAPENLNDKALFAVDQFLMRGGTVIAATSPFQAQWSRQQLTLNTHESGLSDWLAHHGLTQTASLVMDPQNTAFPVPVERNIGGFTIQEMQLLDYPYFADIRGEQLNQKHLITSELPQVTLPWASPIEVDTEKNADRRITPLLYSSDRSWLSTSTRIVPEFNATGMVPYRPEGAQSKQLLALINEGRFDSYFANKPSPLADQGTGDSDLNKSISPSDAASDQETPAPLVLNRVIKRSPESARIILISSNDVFRDQTLTLLANTVQNQYLNALQLAVNAVDWSLEDEALLSIRARGHFNRTLPPMSEQEQIFWESVNYALALMALLLVMLLAKHRKHQKSQRYLAQFSTVVKE